MKIGFFGTPALAAFYLNRLVETHEVLFAVTGEDKPRGRHGTPSPCAVKEDALKNNIPVLQPDKLLDEIFIEKITSFNADIFVVVAYAKKIPPAVFKIPEFGSINIHPSLLPKYRGAAPIQWALIKGESETGVTIQYIDEELDTGDILAQKKISLNSDMTAEDLHDIVLPVGFDLIQEVLNQFSTGTAKPVKQNNEEATYCGKISKETAHINWNLTSVEIHNLIRGLNPKPCAWTGFREKNIKIYKTKLIPEYDNSELKPGFLEVYKKKLIVGTGLGCLEIVELQPEAKKIMDSSSFINGYRLTAADCLKAN
jgi:methionyl-tRNA formyltransferase